MTTEEIFDVWAPPRGRWSRWVKPVLFACMNRRPEPPPPPVEVDAIKRPPQLAEDAALVVDLPGAAGVWAGLALAKRGFRPVPLYNAVPAPTTTLSPGAGLGSPIALVDIQPIMAALSQATLALQPLDLSPDAPPAFLLDWNRRGEGAFVVPGRFDNRSVSFTTDFPSATFLIAHGIRRAVLVQDIGGQPQPDLAHTLRRWQEGGIAIELQQTETSPVPLDVAKPSQFGRLWYRALTLFGLRRHALGGFGGVVPEPSAG